MNSLTVLCVGPATQARTQCVRALEDAGWSVRLTSSESTDIQQLQDQAVDCVVIVGPLSDISLPVFTQELQKHIPLLAIGNTDTEYVQRSDKITYVPSVKMLPDAVETAVQRADMDAALDRQHQFRETVISLIRDIYDASSRTAIEQQAYTHLSDLDWVSYLWLGDYDHEMETIHFTAPVSSEINVDDITTLIGCKDTTSLSQALAADEESRTTVLASTWPGSVTPPSTRHIFGPTLPATRMVRDSTVSTPKTVIPSRSRIPTSRRATAQSRSKTTTECPIVGGTSSVAKSEHTYADSTSGERLLFASGVLSGASISEVSIPTRGPPTGATPSITYSPRCYYPKIYSQFLCGLPWPQAG